MSIKRISIVFFVGLFISGCGGETSQEGASEMETSSASAPAASPQPQTIGDLFPEGDGRALVLNNCSSCHAVACSTIGQRTETRWNSIRLAHIDRLPGLNADEMNTLFGYLSANFSDSMPEPNVPPAFLVMGCTPP
jgi:hypothetical protein